jgi:cytidylate kinase
LQIAPRVIAIDGPAGSGKSTVARALALRLGWTYLETGAIYRALAVTCERDGVAIDDQPAVAGAVERLSLAFRTDPATGCNRVLSGSDDITDRCYAPRISTLASRVSAYPGVRERLVRFQRDFILAHAGTVVEGRDIGTVIAPDAPLKVYLTASPEIRAQRRQEELRAKGTPLQFEEVLADVKARDRQDTERLASPLRQADDAVLMDTSGLGVDEVVDSLISLARQRGL